MTCEHKKEDSTKSLLGFLGGGFKYFLFHPYLGKWSNLTRLPNCEFFLPSVTFSFAWMFTAVLPKPRWGRPFDHRNSWKQPWPGSKWVVPPWENPETTPQAAESSPTRRERTDCQHGTCEFRSVAGQEMKKNHRQWPENPKGLGETFWRIWWMETFCSQAGMTFLVGKHRAAENLHVMLCQKKQLAILCLFDPFWLVLKLQKLLVPLKVNVFDLFWQRPYLEKILEENGGP